MSLGSFPSRANLKSWHLQFPEVSISNENNVRALSTLAFLGHTINIQDIFYRIRCVRSQGQRTSTRGNGLRQFFRHISSKAISNDGPVLELPRDHFNGNKDHVVTGLDCRLHLAVTDIKSTVFCY